MKPTSRPASASDVSRWYPEYSCSFRGWVAELDGEPKGIIGIALTRPYACLFSAFDEELRPYLKSLTVLRLIKKVQHVMETRGLPVLAIAEPDEPKSVGILERLGFTFRCEEDGDQVYEWGC